MLAYSASISLTACPAPPPQVRYHSLRPPLVTSAAASMSVSCGQLPMFGITAPPLSAAMALVTVRSSGTTARLIQSLALEYPSIVKPRFRHALTSSAKTPCQLCVPHFAFSAAT